MRDQRRNGATVVEAAERQRRVLPSHPRRSLESANHGIEAGLSDIGERACGFLSYRSLAVAAPEAVIAEAAGALREAERRFIGEELHESRNRGSAPRLHLSDAASRLRPDQRVIGFQILEPPLH
jgi:hypothetical protein